MKRGPKKGTKYRKSELTKYIYYMNANQRLCINPKWLGENISNLGEKDLKEIILNYKRIINREDISLYITEEKKILIKEFLEKYNFLFDKGKQEFLNSLTTGIEDKLNRLPNLYIQNSIIKADLKIYERLSRKKQEKILNQIRMRKEVIEILLGEIKNRMNYLVGGEYIKDDPETKIFIQGLSRSYNRWDSHRGFVINKFTKEEKMIKLKSLKGICPACETYVGEENLKFEHGYPTICAYTDYLKTGIKRVYTIKDMGFLCKPCNSSKNSKLNWIPLSKKKLDWIPYDDSIPYSYQKPTIKRKSRQIKL